MDELPDTADYQRLPEDNPGGFDWGNREIAEDNGRNENQQNVENNQ